MSTSATDLDRHLPLSEAGFYIMALLSEPRHGYAVMQETTVLTGGRVAIGPGTLYGALTTLEREKLIEFVAEAQRRKTYCLTARGRAVLARQLSRLHLMASVAEQLGLDTQQEAT
jgi:DNA-binding PadR family transcriptional regulator